MRRGNLDTKRRQGCVQTEERPWEDWKNVPICKPRRGLRRNQTASPWVVGTRARTRTTHSGPPLLPGSWNWKLGRATSVNLQLQAWGVRINACCHKPHIHTHIRPVCNIHFGWVQWWPILQIWHYSTGTRISQPCQLPYFAVVAELPFKNKK